MDTFCPLQGTEGLQIAEVTDDMVVGQNLPSGRVCGLDDLTAEGVYPFSIDI